MDKIYFAICLHFHQPIGNFEKIFERAHNFCYKPFFEMLSKYPKIKANIHISGCLLDYLEENHPDTIKAIKKMVLCHQIEIMGGAYYEPILTGISEKDAIGQIEMMSAHIKKRFGVNPKGMWLAERVWAPELVEVIHKAGMRYLILDDEHLLRSGVKEKDIHGFFLTGEGKEKIAAFASHKKLRYSIPFKQAQETIDYLKTALKGKDHFLFTYGDDGEKFGEWPGTHKWVYQDKWLKNFFDKLMENRNWLLTTHLSDYLKKNKPTASLTIRQGSYQEMMEWSEGNWLNFFKKYPEADQMRKKAGYISSRIEDIEKDRRKNNAKKLNEARRFLYKGECNCAYWHGVFGGLYLYHLRKAVYDNLIEAQNIIDALMHKEKDWFNIERLDFDNDGKKETAIIENNRLSICADSKNGGVIKEIDYKPLFFNLVNTLSRKREFYHKKILEAAQKDTSGAKVITIHDDFRKVDPAFRDMLFYDKFERYFLRTYFVKKDLKLDEFISAGFEEIGDFSKGEYNLDIIDNGINLRRTSNVKGALIELQKKIRIKSGDIIEFSFAIKKDADLNLDALFGIEFNLTTPDLNSDRYNYFIDGKFKNNLEAKGYEFPQRLFEIRDSSGEFGLGFEFFKKPKGLIYFPVKTISQSERAYELNYQCSCIFPMWELDFAREEKLEFKFYGRR